ncbi:MAG: hypothetical protein JRI25_14135, partial [Deltaproteobacteria bacterium]|nr:hypothetical protein [Deltaproteobacteria bacterium]
MPDLEHQIRTAAEWIADSHHLVVFTGAGISTDSGLPDYRGPDGVWTRRDKGLPPPKWGVAPDQVRPNRGHLALVALQEMGLLGFLISQNVDGLHLASGIEPERIAELHGNTNLVKCLGCDGRYANTSVGWDKEVWGPGYRTHRPRPGQPACPTCGGRLISSIVNFDDPMPEHEMALAYRHSEASERPATCSSRSAPRWWSHPPTTCRRRRSARARGSSSSTWGRRLSAHWHTSALQLLLERCCPWWWKRCATDRRTNPEFGSRTNPEFGSEPLGFAADYLRADSKAAARVGSAAMSYMSASNRSAVRPCSPRMASARAGSAWMAASTATALTISASAAGAASVVPSGSVGAVEVPQAGAPRTTSPSNSAGMVLFMVGPSVISVASWCRRPRQRRLAQRRLA